MMKRIAILLFLALAPVAAFAQSFGAIMTGAAEVPGPGDPDGSGIAVITVSGTTINYSLLVQGIGTATAAHIHRGAAGVAGPVVVELNAGTLANGSVSGVSQALINEILANPSGFYVNVHNAEFPNGAIRGQLVSTTQGDGTRVAFIPVIAHSSGANNTNFVTDLRIVNNGALPAAVTLDFYAQNPAGNAAPTATNSITIAPGEEKVLNDVASAQFGVANGLGALKITSDQNVVASARIINDLRSLNLGTAGFALTAKESGSRSSTITFLAQSADYRTNIGYFNAAGSPVTVTLTARRSDGAILGSNTLTIPAFTMVQQPAFSLISNVPAADRTQTDFYVNWTSTAPVFIYGAVTDNKTGDAVVNQ